MVVLIAGASHTGKTLLSHRLIRLRPCPCLSIDLLKMGLIRSGHTSLTPEDDGALTALLWPIVREMIKTAIENGQDLVVEGAYIPFDWKRDFSPRYLEEIQCRCLVMSRAYIQKHFSQIKKYAHAAERRLDDSSCTLESVLADNAETLRLCRKYGCDYVLIQEPYRVEPEEIFHLP